MVDLFVADDPDLLVWGEILLFEERRPDILGDIDAGAVAAEDHLCSQRRVMEVDDDRAVLASCKDPLFESPGDDVLSQLVGLALQVELVEVDSHASVCFVESLEDPFVHRLPELSHLRVSRLPALEHL